MLVQAGSHAKYRCYICAQMVPDMKTMQVCKCHAAQIHIALKTINLLIGRLCLTRCMQTWLCLG